ncbi:MAG TPA: ABC transporter substrate-binding protein [Xanthobacteraceae bacterium]|jgi:putative tryptophan/tyrosine transport system substrate-binding protein|nr:ABC transporter substrate-binding protein [Xanthobacteraceae bacterium]
MKRRAFITLLGGAAAAWPLTARAQQPARLRTVGFLGAAGPAVASHWLAAFVQRLHELGWSEGRNVAFEVRWAEGRRERATEFAAEFVRRKVDVIATWATMPALVIKQATSDIPVVFALATDPVGVGLVASLARPGGNVTGLSAFNVDIAGKRVELLREVVPRLERLAIMANVGVPDSATELRAIQAMARTFGITVSPLEIQREEDIAPAFDSLKGGAEGLFVVGDPLTFLHRAQIIARALNERLPTTCAIREFVAAGALMSYGTNFPDLFRRAAEHVDRILRGTKPADIPVEQPIKFDFAINLKTAKALGLDVPPMVLARADEVIE